MTDVAASSDTATVGLSEEMVTFVQETAAHVAAQTAAHVAANVAAQVVNKTLELYNENVSAALTEQANRAAEVVAEVVEETNRAMATLNAEIARLREIAKPMNVKKMLWSDDGDLTATVELYTEGQVALLSDLVNGRRVTATPPPGWSG